MFLDFSRAELLYIIRCVKLTTPLLHAWESHGHSIGDLCSQMICLAIYAKSMSTLEAEKVLMGELFVANFTDFTCSLLNRLGYPVNEVLIKVPDKPG